MTIARHPVAFACGQDWLLGVVTRPEKPHSRGVVIVVGGPQYRAGSHRQFRDSHVSVLKRIETVEVRFEQWQRSGSLHGKREPLPQR